MNILGHGIDIIEIRRVARAMERTPRFLLRVFTKEENDYLTKKSDSARTAAGIFAAKEAAVKAMGTGFGAVKFHDIMLTWDGCGKPSLTIKGYENIDFLLSITHCSDYAAASGIAVRRDCK